MPWHDEARIRRDLEAAFNAVLATRMRDLPLVNPALSVEAVGFKRCGEDWLGVMVTPWSMNLLLLPGENSAWQGLATGGKIERQFPFGLYEFTLGDDELIGRYALCSLFSPMLEFADHASALAAAQAALQTLLTAPRRQLSRRDLLRGSFGNTP
jgi:[NiFe] hydrogenase assembly HybE family chaperone